jgi:hypothetical protein
VGTAARTAGRGEAPRPAGRVGDGRRGAAFFAFLRVVTW